MSNLATVHEGSFELLPRRLQHIICCEYQFGTGFVTSLLEKSLVLAQLSLVQVSSELDNDTLILGVGVGVVVAHVISHHVTLHLKFLLLILQDDPCKSHIQMVQVIDKP